MESTAQFDVVAVVGRLASLLPLEGASLQVADWALTAAGQVKRWAESVEAEAFHERELAVLFPPLPEPTDAAAGDSDAVPSGSDASGGDQTSSPSSPPATDGAVADDAATEPAGGSNAGDPAEQPLPSLGPGAAPETAAEHERLARRSWLLSHLLLFAAAHRSGRVTTGHVDVLAMYLYRLAERVQQRLFDREADLLAAALTTRVDGFGRMVRKEIAKASDDEGVGRLRDQRQRSFLRHWVRGDDMHGMYLELDPERGAPLFAALEAEMAALYASGAAKGLTREQVAINAFCNLQSRPATPSADASAPATETEANVSAPDDPTSRAEAPEGRATGAGVADRGRVRTRRRSGPTKGQLVVLIDITTLIDGSHDLTVCETASGVPLPPSVARQMLCRAAIVYGLTFNGRLVGMSSKQRLATEQQRLMLRMMYRTCAFPGCDVGVKDCEVHHVIHAAKGGATAVETMIPLCRRRHHDAVHDEGWKVRIDARRTLTWARPGGEIYDVVPFVGLADLDHLSATDARAGPARLTGQATLFDVSGGSPAA